MSGGVPPQEVSYDLFCLLSLLLPGGLFSQRAVVSCGRRAPAPAVQMAPADSWRASSSRRERPQKCSTSFPVQRVPHVLHFFVGRSVRRTLVQPFSTARRAF